MKRISAFFYAAASGREPVREWLMQMDKADRKEVGRSLMTLEFGWPIGMPLSRPMGKGLHELRVDLSGQREARVFFYIDSQQRLILLHALIKKTRTTPARDLDLARKRMADHARSMQ
ncbi:MAG TPA: type II toxin-antitoxin system RelE/ParE family toxin [Steroidobacteraceae bacterium]|nr:type II toxin-antitoxin system RelE/ParE family toxin [Steroidobacteraceae bacterium]